MGSRGSRFGNVDFWQLLVCCEYSYSIQNTEEAKTAKPRPVAHIIISSEADPVYH